MLIGATKGILMIQLALNAACEPRPKWNCFVQCSSNRIENQDSDMAMAAILDRIFCEPLTCLRFPVTAEFFVSGNFCAEHLKFILKFNIY